MGDNKSATEEWTPCSMVEKHSKSVSIEHYSGGKSIKSENWRQERHTHSCNGRTITHTNWQKQY